MNTCVLCLSRRNAFECTIRSRSRWNGVRTGESSSGTARVAEYDRVANGESLASSNASTRSRKAVSDAGSAVLGATERLSQQRWRDLTTGALRNLFCDAGA